MKAVDLDQHMRKVGTWVDWNNSVDRFIIGDPQTEVRGIAVGWQSRTQALKEALEKGCNLFVTHEPTFYRHRDNDDSVFSQPHAAAKKKMIQDNGLVIYRCHDVWDQMPKVGIVDSWATHLGFGPRLNAARFHQVYEAPETTLGSLAKYVAARTSYLNQERVEMVGDPHAKVSKVAIGCGAITNYRTMLEIGADVIIGTDDGMRYWYGGAWALDRGVPLIIVNHCTAEEAGMRSLANYIGEQFKGTKAVHIPQGCMFRIVR